MSLKYYLDHHSSLKTQIYGEIPNLSCRSSTPVTWICERSHIYEMAPRKKIIEGRKCPYCTGKKISDEYNSLFKVSPSIASEWDYELNDSSLNPHNVGYSSNKTVYWKCSNGHSWKTSINNRVNKQSKCPFCNASAQTSQMEQMLYFVLKSSFEDTVNRVKLDNIEFDIYVPSQKLVLEYNGRYYHDGISDNKVYYCLNHNLLLININETYEKVEPYIDYTTNTIIFNADNISTLKPVVLLEICGLISIILNKHNILFNYSITSNLEQQVNELIQLSDFENSLGNKFPELVQDWDFEKNGNLTPYNINSVQPFLTSFIGYLEI